MTRVLVTLSPLMYRQAVALSIQRGRPGLVDVRIAPPEAMEEQLASFRPHLLVHNDARGTDRGGSVPISEEALRRAPHRIEVLYSDGMDARLSADGTLTELGDASTEDLLAARGLSNERIASSLHIAEATVKRHLANVYPKMGVSSRGEAAREALTREWITIEELTSEDDEES